MYGERKREKERKRQCIDFVRYISAKIDYDQTAFERQTHQW